ncbi:DinB family protein [Dyadobacter fanqingshengii]|uniref:DinB family protein n=1 Tax=Dyadobacter fanqingshengii TaxID=2906443 RepID=A0A9X1T980_9BACT|nr:DinB family protein [Dyadobacter fanqingshengii]MCF0040940.1 DinB family protein [Dyadobacter fanqingshengii]MCF2505957.1 DinB family protein [Dyadobacter fanqingshengii]USJ37328.1 DinB family protein [Dyadobacter fanqingshengii]
METKLIKKSIAINAPKENVWKVMISNDKNKIWYNAFSEGTQAETDWQVGSKAVFSDDSKSGIVGIITVNKPAEELVIEYTGVLNNGVENYENEEAQSVKGFQEFYWLKEENGVTRLDMQCDMGIDYFEMMSDAWDHALIIVRELAETDTSASALLDQLDNTTKNFLEAIDAFDENEINEVPFEGSWTGGQVVEHILKSESGLPDMLLGDYADTQRPVDANIAEIEHIFLDFSTKMKAPDFNVPSNGPHNKAELVAAFQKEREEIRKVAAEHDLSLTATAFAFPGVGKLTRWEWLNFVVCHSKRHIYQLKNIRKKLSEKVAG